MEQHYPIREVAAKLSCSEQTVLRMIKRGRLKAKQLGKEYRVSEKEIAMSLTPIKHDLSGPIR